MTAENKTETPRSDAFEGPEGGHARTCVGCGSAVSTSVVRRADGRTRRGSSEAEKRPLVRLLLGPPVDASAEQGKARREIAVDTGARSPSGGGVSRAWGRGVYVHAEPRCIAGAATRGLPRAAKSAVAIQGAPLTAELLANEIARAFERRAESLFLAAKRARKVEAGSIAATTAVKRGDAALVVVATDAAAAADLTEVRLAVSEGRAIAWGTKREIAARLGGTHTEGVGVVAVTDDRLAAALLESRRIVEMSSAPIEAPAREGRGAASPRPQRPEAAARPTREADSGGRKGDTRSSRVTERDASILVGGAANLRGPARPGSPGSPARSRGGSRRRGVKSA